MDFGKHCSVELERSGAGHYYHEDLFFSLEDIKHIPMITQHLNHIDDIAINPFHITDESKMEAYWLTLSIKVVDVIQDKNIVLLSETGKSSLEEVDEDIIELWDNTYFEVLKGDLKRFKKNLIRYLSFIEKNEASLRKEYDKPNKAYQGIYYQIY